MQRDLPKIASLELQPRNAHGKFPYFASPGRQAINGKSGRGCSMSFRTIIGLEVHVQLLTRTKLFCGCSTQFGLPANTATCPVCIGMPGVMPVMNRRAFELALKAALALHCRIA